MQGRSWTGELNTDANPPISQSGRTFARHGSDDSSDDEFGEFGEQACRMLRAKAFGLQDAVNTIRNKLDEAENARDEYRAFLQLKQKQLGEDPMDFEESGTPIRDISGSLSQQLEIRERVQSRAIAKY